MNRLGKAQLFRPVSKGQTSQLKTHSIKQSYSPTKKDGNLIEEFKNRFQKVADSCSVFYNKRSQFIPASQKFGNALSSSISSFTSFYDVLARFCGQTPTIKQGRKTGLISGANAIHKAAEPFLKNWKQFSEILSKFENPQTKLFSKACYVTLNEICAIDPSIVDQMREIGAEFEKFLNETENSKIYQEQITESLESISATKEDNDKAKKLLRDISSLMGEFNKFNSDVSVMIDDFESFQDLLSYFIDKLGLNGAVIRIGSSRYHKPEEESKQEEETHEFSLNPTLELFEFIDDSRKAFEPEMNAHISMFFDALYGTALSYKEKHKKEQEEVLKQKNEMTNDLSNKNNDLQIKIATITEESIKASKRVQELEDEVKRMKANTIYYDCLVEALKEDVSLLTKEQIMGKLQKMIKSKNENETKNAETEKQMNEIKEILSIFGSEEESAKELASAAVESYQTLNNEKEKVFGEKTEANNKAEEYKRCIEQIIALFERTENKETDFCRFAIQSAKNQISLFKKEIEESKASQSGETTKLLEQLNEITNAKKELENNLKKKTETIKEVEIKLRKLVNQQISEEVNESSVMQALSLVEESFAKNKTATTKKTSDQEEMKDIAAKLKAIVGNKESIPQDECYTMSISMIDQIRQMIRDLKKDSRTNKEDNIHTKASLEMVYSKLKNYLNLKPSNDDKNLTTSQLMHQIMSLLDAFSNKSTDENTFTSKDIDSLCSEVLINGGLTNNTNPHMYLPEICFTYTIQHESIKALRPFNEALDYLFTHFDGKFSSFKPSSDQFKYLRTTVSKLQDSLNSIVPNRVSTEIFHVLSRFVSLVNSYMAAFVSISVEPTK